MRKMMMVLGCAAMTVPATMVVPVSDAGAQRYKYREWRDDNGRLRCRKPNGTTGMVVGGVAGALLGRTVDSKGDRTLGTVGGAVAGGLLGREVDRNTGSNKNRCR